MKPRVCVYLSDHLAARLHLAAKEPGGSKSAIVELALERFLDIERDRGLDPALLRRLDKTSNILSIVERDVAIVTETVALFVRYFLTITPPLPEPEQAAARALGRQRFQVFVAQVGRRLGTDSRLVSEVLETIVATNPDLFATATDDPPPTDDETVDSSDSSDVGHAYAQDLGQESEHHA